MIKLNNLLKFSVDNINFVDEIERSFFRKIRIKAFSSGDNAHTLDVEEDVIRRGARTVYNKPILWKYNKYFDDAEGHGEDEVPCGFVPENEDNPVELIKENGRLYIVINALIWTRYSGKLIEIFKRDGNRKDVSVEMQVIDNRENKEFSPDVKVDDFVIAGITILGEMINPACKGCEAELLDFSEDKKKFLEDINSMPIDNSINSSIDGNWNNPRRKLFSPIIKFSNSKTLLNEAYFCSNNIDENFEISNFEYPHHVISNGKLVLHKRGLYSAFKKMSQNHVINDDNILHIYKHYKELGLSSSNFMEFGLSKKDFDLYFSKFFIEEKVGDLSMSEEKKDTMEFEKEDNNTTEDIKESKEENMETEEVKESDGCAKEEDMGCHKSEEENFEDDNDDNKEEEKENEEEPDDDDDDKEEKMSYEEMSCKMKEMSDKIKELEECNKSYMSKLEAMSDYDELKKFKCDTEERMAREKEMADMEKVMSDIENRGISMSEDDKKEFMGKIKEFSNINAWSNYVKAQAFDRVENIDGVVRIGLPYTNNNTKPKSIWDEI